MRRYNPPAPPFLQGQLRSNLGESGEGYPLLHKQCSSVDANYMCVIGCGCARDCCSPLLLSLTVLRRLQTEMFAAGWSDGTVRACLVLVHRVPLMIGVWQVSIYSVGSSAPWCSLPLRSGHAARYAHTLQHLSHVMLCT